MKLILFNALERNEKKILSPLGLFEELEDFVKRSSEYDYLREDVVDGYHDARNFIQTVRDMYLEELDSEVRNSLGIHDDKQYAAFLKKYVHHVTAYLKKEKIKNTVSGQPESPDKTLLDEFENIVRAGDDREAFRQNVLTQLGVYALEHPTASQEKDGMNYVKVFPDLLKKIKDFYIDEQKLLLRKAYDGLTLFDFSQESSRNNASKTVEQMEAEKLSRDILSGMQKNYGYNDISAREAFIYLVQKRY